jgi:hypothetical protein
MDCLTTRYPNRLELDHIFESSGEMAARFGSDWIDLPTVGGGGCASHPKVALVFINPTGRNQSASERWPGERAPFIGLSRIWRVLSQAGIVAPEMLLDMMPDGSWTLPFASDFYRCVADRGLYVTNLVKACRKDATLPTLRMARESAPALVDELTVVQPDVVVAMGGMVGTVLSGSPVKLEDDYRRFVETGRLRERSIPGTDVRLASVYFPIGRGNPVRAKEMLGAVAADALLD